MTGFEERIVLLPPAAGNYDRLAAISGKLLYRRVPLAGQPEDAKSPLVFYDLKEREEKTVVEDVDGFEAAAEGTKLLVWKKEDYAIVEPKPDQKLEKKLATQELERTIDPRAEWRQLFDDAWRFERDYFYDPACTA